MTESVEQVAEKLGLFARVGLFYRQVVSELRKVVWPTRDDVISSVKVVVVSTIIIAILLGLLDALLVSGVNLVF